MNSPDAPTRRPLGRVARGIQKVADDFPWLGPLILNLSVTYFVVQILVAAAWRHPAYDWAKNTISDLGNTSFLKHPYERCRAAGAPDCLRAFSPLHFWMNAEFVLLGLVMATGSVLIAQEFRSSTPPLRRDLIFGAFAMIGVGGVGSALVGFFPENTVAALHAAGAGLAIALGSAGIALLGWTLRLPQYLQWPMRVVPPIAILAGGLFVFHLYLGLGAGTIERVAQYPETIWLIVFGAYISHNQFRRLQGAPSPHDPLPPVAGNQS